MKFLDKIIVSFLVISLAVTKSQGWLSNKVSSLSHRPCCLRDTTASTAPRLITLYGKTDKQRGMIDFMNEPMESMVGDVAPKVPPERDELAGLVRCIVKAADGRKADDIVALRVSPVSTLTSFVVILSGNSRPQNQAIAAAIKQDVEEYYNMLPGSSGVPEGDAQSGWMVLDYGSVMVHVMTPKSRLYYNVEGQWKDKGGEYMDISDVILPNSMEGMLNAGQATTATSTAFSKENDPFWS